MHHVTVGTCMLQLEHGGHIWKNGNLLRKLFLSRDVVQNLKVSPNVHRLIQEAEKKPKYT